MSWINPMCGESIRRDEKRTQCCFGLLVQTLRQFQEKSFTRPFYKTDCNQHRNISTVPSPPSLSTSPNENLSTSVDLNNFCLSNPSIQSEHAEIITDFMIKKAADFVSQLVCVCLTYSTYKPTASSSSQFIHSCSVCENSFSSQIMSFFSSPNPNYEVSTLSSNPSGSALTMGTPSSLIVYQQQQNTRPLICALLRKLQQKIHLRTCELICSLYFFSNVLKRHWECSSLFLLRNSLFIVFVVCLLLSHKMNNDSVMNNRWWADTAVHCVENNGDGVGLGMGMGYSSSPSPFPSLSVRDRYLVNNASLDLTSSKVKAMGKEKEKKDIGVGKGMGMEKEMERDECSFKEKEFENESLYEDNDDDANEFDISKPRKSQKSNSKANPWFKNCSSSSSRPSLSTSFIPNPATHTNPQTNFNPRASTWTTGASIKTGVEAAAVGGENMNSIPGQMLLKLNELEWMVLVLLEHSLTLDADMYEKMRSFVAR